MNRVLRKIPALMLILLGVCSMPITALAYYAYRYGVEISTIQTAEYSVLVCLADEETEQYLEDYTFNGTEGEEGMAFELTASGTANATGYCEILLNEQSYYTVPLEVGSSMEVTVKGNSEDTVRFVTHWGKPHTEAEPISGENPIGTYTPAATAEPVPMAEPTAEPTATPTAEPET